MATLRMFRDLPQQLIVVALLSVWPPPGLWAQQAHQEPTPPKGQVLVQQESDTLLFDPAHQKPLKYENKQVLIQLEKENWNLREGWKLTVLVRRNGATEQRIPLPHEMAQVNEIRSSSGNKAVVVGMLNGDAWVFAVLDLETYQVIDTVWCYDPAVSPDGRYITFIKFFPTHFVSNVEDHYMLYDTKLTPLQNRSLGTSAAAGRIFLAVNAGTAVYPPGIRNNDGDNTDVAPESAHFMASRGFFWHPDSIAYAFADMYQGALYVVRVQLISEPLKPRVSRAEIARGELCANIHKAKCEASLTSVQFQPHQISATFQGSGENASVRETLPLPDKLFHDVP